MVQGFKDFRVEPELDSKTLFFSPLLYIDSSFITRFFWVSNYICGVSTRFGDLAGKKKKEKEMSLIIRHESNKQCMNYRVELGQRSQSQTWRHQTSNVMRDRGTVGRVGTVMN